MAEFSFSSVGLAESELEALQAVLTLSERALKASWRYFANREDTDAILVSLDSKQGKVLWDSHSLKDSSRCLVACANDVDIDARWKLKVSPGSLPSRKELIELLNALADHLSGQPAEAGIQPETAPSPVAVEKPSFQPEPSPIALEVPPPSAATATPAAPTEPSIPTQVFDPGRHFVGLLHDAITAGEDVAFTLPGQNWWLAISSRERIYYTFSSTEDLQPLFLADVDDIKQHKMPIEKLLASETGQKLKSYPLEELLWHASVASSKGRLWIGCQPQDIVRLKHWPPVAHLPSYRKFLKIAAFMTHNASSLQCISEHTGRPLADIIDFHNACEAMGLIERDLDEELVAKSTQGVMGDLYKKISSRLSQAVSAGKQP